MTLFFKDVLFVKVSIWNANLARATLPIWTMKNCSRNNFEIYEVENRTSPVGTRICEPSYYMYCLLMQYSGTRLSKMPQKMVCYMIIVSQCINRWQIHYLAPLHCTLTELTLDTDGSNRIVTLLFEDVQKRQNGQYFPNDIFKCIFLNWNVWMMSWLL